MFDYQRYLCHVIGVSDLVFKQPVKSAAISHCWSNPQSFRVTLFLKVTASRQCKFPMLPWPAAAMAALVARVRRSELRERVEIWVHHRDNSTVLRWKPHWNTWLISSTEIRVKAFNASNRHGASMWVGKRTDLIFCPIRKHWWRPWTMAFAYGRGLFWLTPMASTWHPPYVSQQLWQILKLRWIGKSW